MKKVKINRLNLVLYDGIDEMPMDNFREFNRYVLIESGIGSDMQAVDSKLATIIRFMQLDKKESATKELLNMRQAIALVLAGTNLELMSFVPFIHSINGKPVTDLSQEGVKEILFRLEKARVETGWVLRTKSALKKKLTLNLMFYFLRTRKQPGSKTNTT